jgi:beta-glucosidase
MRDLFKNDSTVSPRDAAALRNGVEKYTRKKTRLGIPVVFFGEALHGYMAYDSTSFPQVLGLASSWDPELVRQVFTAAADEMPSRKQITAVGGRLVIVGNPATGPRNGET